MGSECFPRKHHYDISMSKRTRKPTLNLNQEASDHHQDSFPAESCTTASVKINQVVNEVCDQGEESNDRSKKSLKQLIEGRRGTSLGEHFTAEEKQLQMVVKQPEDGGSNGVKLMQMVSRYTKVLSHMMRLKRDPSLGLSKKPPFRLKAQLQKS